ncbi:MAG: lysine--tRNA ligase, partial [Bdellovibrionales bacterium]|nr:lysine--tRNA ligase [Bdellovibrionales bacterium]
VYTVAAGISPSGVVHFGNLRDVMTAYAVYQELMQRGKTARFLFSWDDFDRFRKVPVGFDDSLEQYIGLPLSAVPDPLDEFSSYGERFEKQFEYSMKQLGISMEYRYQTQEYKSGRYDQQIFHALNNRMAIADNLLSHMSDKAIVAKEINREQYRDEFYPINLYSRFSGKDNTRILNFDGHTSIEYECLDSGQIEKVDLSQDRIAKLHWKIDWPMRWREEQVHFEPGGQDHASPGGSYDVSSKVCKEIFDTDSPIFVGYEFVGIRGLEGKMSGSKGGAMAPDQLLRIYEPSILSWLYNRRSPVSTFELAFDTEVYRHYDEYDKACGRARKGKLQTAELKALELSGAAISPDTEENLPIPFRNAVALGQIVQWNFEKLLQLCEDLGYSYSPESIKVRMDKARSWLIEYNPQDAIELRSTVNESYVRQMSKDALSNVRKLRQALMAGTKTLADLNSLVYGIPKDPNATEEENKVKQKDFFNDVYHLLIGEGTGPRLSTFLWVIDRTEANRLLEV